MMIARTKNNPAENKLYLMLFLKEEIFVVKLVSVFIVEIANDEFS